MALVQPTMLGAVRVWFCKPVGFGSCSSSNGALHSGNPAPPVNYTPNPVPLLGGEPSAAYQWIKEISDKTGSGQWPAQRFFQVDGSFHRLQDNVFSRTLVSMAAAQSTTTAVDAGMGRSPMSLHSIMFYGTETRSPVTLAEVSATPPAAWRHNAVLPDGQQGRSKCQSTKWHHA